MKYASLDLGTVEAVFNKLGGLEGARAFLRGEQKLTSVSFERNEHGHIVLTLDSLDLTGKQEIERLTAAGFSVGDWAKSCLLSTKKDGYDKNHRLVAGQQHKVALVPTKDVGGNRTTGREYGFSFGYGQLLAGAVLRIREIVSDKQMEEMGFWYIAAPHDPITNSDGVPLVLRASRYDGGPWLGADWDHPGRRWLANGAFAFLVPAS